MGRRKEAQLIVEKRRLQLDACEQVLGATALVLAIALG